MFEEIAHVLQSYGPWGVTAIFAVASLKLYRDLTGTYRHRVEDLKSVTSDYHTDMKENVAAWKDAARVLESVYDELARRRNR